MALNRSALCPNCFTPGKVLLVHTEEDDGRDVELVWIHAEEKSLQLVKGINPDSSISQPAAWHHID